MKSNMDNFQLYGVFIFTKAKNYKYGFDKIVISTFKIRNKKK